MQCRIYHLGVAGNPVGGGPEVHCPHGAPDGGGVCTGAAMGGSCDNPFVVPGLPFSVQNDTSSASADASSGCSAPVANGGGSPDHVYAFTAPEAGTFRVTLEAGFDSLLYVATGCGGGAEACLGAADALGKDQVEQVTVELSGGETVFAIVDGWAAAAPIAGPYSLSIEPVAVPGLTCQYYCDVIENACTDGLDPYPNDDCSAYCNAKFEPGTFGDTAGDTLGCRIYHAEVAAQGDAEVHCPHAGPTGGGVCGEWCEVYCGLAAQCEGLYADDDACAAACAEFEEGPADGDTVQCRILALAGGDCAAGAADGGGVCVPPPVGDSCADPHPVEALPFTANSSTAGANNESSSGCADFFDGAASRDEVYAYTPDFDGAIVVTLVGDFDSLLYAESACGEPDSCLLQDDQGQSQQESLRRSVTAGTPVYVWVDGFDGINDESGTYTLTIEALAPELSCDYYCELMEATCGGLADCQEVCATFHGWPEGPGIGAGGNTLGCRIAQAQAGDCTAASPSGGNVCGTWCEVYCDLEAKNCPDGDSLYADHAECLAACDDFFDGGQAGETSGDSVQCRIYHLGVAGDPDAGGAAVHCPHGAVDGGGVCVATPGDSCQAPFEITELPFDGEGDTTLAEGDFASTCVGSFTGSVSGDQVWTYTPIKDQELEIHVDPLDFDAVLYVQDGCGGACTAHSDVAGFATGTLVIQATAGQEVAIVVDGYSDILNENGSYTLTMWVTDEPPPAPVDLSGWTVLQEASSQSFVLPAGTQALPGDYVIVSRDSDQAAFEAHWGVTLGDNVVFVNSGGEMPKINGGETYELLDATGASVEGPTAPAFDDTKVHQRLVPVGPATDPASWAIVSQGEATPGGGQAESADGVYFSEVADATGTGNFVYEYVELYVSSAP